MLKQTLDSFRARMFCNFDLKKVIVNIDPIFGDDADHRQVVELVSALGGELILHQPETPGFCAAVKRNWLASSAKTLFHLEDDWILQNSLGPEATEGFRAPGVKQVSLYTHHKNWNLAKKGVFHYRRRKVRLLGLKLSLPGKMPCFTTSPSFLDGDFARACASMMDVRFDPEKQFYQGVNPALQRYVQPYRTMIYSKSDGGDLIKDIGVSWRQQRGIIKKNVSGRSEWLNG